MELHELERRRHRRFPVQAGIYVAIKKKRFFNWTKPQFIKLGPLLDISMGGVAIHYIESHERDQTYASLCLVTAAGEVPFEDLSVRMVFDRKVAELPDQKWIHKRALEFDDLSGRHAIHMEDFILRIETGALVQGVIEKTVAFPLP